MAETMTNGTNPTNRKQVINLVDNRIFIEFSPFLHLQNPAHIHKPCGDKNHDSYKDTIQTSLVDILKGFNPLFCAGLNHQPMVTIALPGRLFNSVMFHNNWPKMQGEMYSTMLLES
jgi:hypothetical protein